MEEKEEEERRDVFLSSCAQAERSVSAIVPGLPVKTARLL